MIDALILTAALLAPTEPPNPEPHRVTAPSRGMVGRFQDSNVAKVWAGATAAERMTWLCIRRHESMSYRGDNPTSSASGAGPWILSTWTGLKHWVRVEGEYVAREYHQAKDAPAWVQDAAFRHVYDHGGLSMWRGTNCPGTG